MLVGCHSGRANGENAEGPFLGIDLIQFRIDAIDNIRARFAGDQFDHNKSVISHCHPQTYLTGLTYFPSSTTITQARRLMTSAAQKLGTGKDEPSRVLLGPIPIEQNGEYYLPGLVVYSTGETDRIVAPEYTKDPKTTETWKALHLLEHWLVGTGTPGSARLS